MSACAIAAGAVGSRACGKAPLEGLAGRAVVPRAGEGYRRRGRGGGPSLLESQSAVRMAGADSAPRGLSAQDRLASRGPGTSVRWLGEVEAHVTGDVKLRRLL